MKCKDVRRILGGVTYKTINNYIKQGKLHPMKMSKTHYEYDEDEVYALVGKSKSKVNVTYARVSSVKQKSDLQSQNERLYDFCARNGISIDDQIQDVKSGMSFSDRKGFSKLMEMVIGRNVGKVVIENRDRLCRFGYDLVESVFKNYGTEIVVMSNVDNKSYEEELTDDLISIIHYYSMKSYSHRTQLHKAENALLEKTNA